MSAAPHSAGSRLECFKMTDIALINHVLTQPTPEWRARSESILETLLRDKFRRNAKARDILVGTGRVRLIYNNSHDDRVWGVCSGKQERVYFVLISYEP